MKRAVFICVLGVIAVPTACYFLMETRGNSFKVFRPIPGTAKNTAQVSEAVTENDDSFFVPAAEPLMQGSLRQQNIALAHDGPTPVSAQFSASSYDVSDVSYDRQAGLSDVPAGASEADAGKIIYRLGAERSDTYESRRVREALSENAEIASMEQQHDIVIGDVDCRETACKVALHASSHIVASQFRFLVGQTLQAGSFVIPVLTHEGVVGAGGYMAVDGYLLAGRQTSLQ